MSSLRKQFLPGQSDDSTRNPIARISGGFAVIVASLAQIVLKLRYGQCPPQNTVLPEQRYMVVHHLDFREPINVYHNIAQITYVPVLVIWATVILAVGIVVWSSRKTTARKVSKLMDV